MGGKSRTKFLLLIFVFLFGLGNIVNAKKSKNFLALEPIVNTNNSDLKLKVFESSLEQTSKKVNIVTNINLLPSISSFPAYFSINLYKFVDGEKNYLSKVNLSILNKKQARSSLVNFDFDYYPSSTTEDFYIDIYDLDQNLIASYKQEFNFSDALLSLNPSTNGLTDYTCSDGDGPCLLEYILGNIKFYSSLEPSLQTQVIKEDDQPYKIISPLLRRKRLKVARLGGSQEVINIKSKLFDEIDLGSSSNFARLVYDESKLNFKFNDKTTLTLNSNGEVNNLVLEETNPSNLERVPGKFEYDGEQLYFTNRYSRNRVFLGTPSGGGSGIAPDSTLSGTTTIDGDIVANQSLVFDSMKVNAAGAAVNVNWHTGNRHQLTLDQATTLSFTAPPGVAHLTLVLIQDATGSHTVTWPANVRWPNSVAPNLTTTANQIDIITCFYNGSLYFCQSGLNYSP